MARNHKIIILFLLHLTTISVYSQIFPDWQVRREFNKQLKRDKWALEKEFDNLSKGDTIDFSSDYKQNKLIKAQFQIDTTTKPPLPKRSSYHNIRFTRKHKMQIHTWTKVCKKRKGGGYVTSAVFFWKDIGEWHITNKGYGDLIILYNKKTYVLNWFQRYNEFIQFIVTDIKQAN